ncbi:hypothetical protein G7046_g2494 [Stylonectria norvegica]|nr:hypothetical protein G7046_g2494 [Stylonectria norvegica]
MTPPSTGDTVRRPRKRRRPARSCDECRRRKIKCDLAQPCAHLATAASAVLPKLISAQDGPSPLESRRSEESRLSITGWTGPPLRLDDQVQSPSIPLPNSRDHEGQEAVEVEVLKRRIAALEEYIKLSENGSQRPVNGIELQAACDSPHRISCDAVLASARVQEKQQSQTHRPPVYISEGLPPLQTQQLLLNKSRLYGPTHWSHGGNEFKRVAVLAPGFCGAAEVDATRQLKLDLQTLIHKCKLMARSIKSVRPGGYMSSEQRMPEEADIDFSNQMVEVYLSHFESAFRILHIPSFRAEYGDYWRNPKEAPLHVQFKVQLVIAIGSSLYQNAHDADLVRSRSCQWVHAAQSWTSGLMEKNRLSLSGLQIQALVILARQVLSIGGDLIWIAVGTLVRTAMHMGLHLYKNRSKIRVLSVKCEHFASSQRIVDFTMAFIMSKDFASIRSNTSCRTAEIRKRMWATILEMNVQASLDSGTPLAVSLDEIDIDIPSDINDEDINETTMALSPPPPPDSDHTVTDTTLQRLMLKTLQLRMAIVRRINSRGLGFSPGEVQSMTLDLKKACDDGEACLKRDDGDQASIFKLNMTDLLVRRFLLTLHRPLISGSGTSHPESYFSRKVCLDSTTAILSPLPNADFAYLSLVGGGFFKNRIIHASLALCSELLLDLEENGQTRRLSNYRTMLIGALGECLKQVAGRIQHGETNVRLHMKLSIVMRQAELSDVRFIVRQQCLMEAAKESLEVSCATMGARLDSIISGLPQDMRSLEVDEPDQNLLFSISQDLDDLFGTIDYGANGLFDRSELRRRNGDLTCYYTSPDKDARRSGLDHSQPSVLDVSVPHPQIEDLPDRNINLSLEDRIWSSPAARASSGFSGPTSFSAAYLETETNLTVRDPPVTMDAASPQPTASTPPSLTEVHHMANLDPGASHLAIRVLRAIPQRSSTTIHLDPHICVFDEWMRSIGEKLHVSTWETFGCYLLDRENLAKLRHLGSMICINTRRTIKEDQDDAQTWLESFAGPNLRWESVGMLFICAAFGELSSSYSADSKILISRYTEYCSACISLANMGGSSGSIMLLLLYKRSMLHAYMHGETSLPYWKFHAETVAMLTFSGFHDNQSGESVTTSSVSTVSTEVRRRVGCQVFIADKFLATCVGRPPLLTRRFCSMKLPLDLDDAILLSDRDTFETYVSHSLDANGWNVDGLFHSSSLLRVRMMVALIRDEILELGQSNSGTYAADDIANLKSKELNLYGGLPAHVVCNFTVDDMRDIEPRAVYPKILIRLDYLLNMFLIERLIVKHGHSRSHLLRTSFEMIVLTLHLWTQKRIWAEAQEECQWLMMAFAAPAGAVLCMELIHQNPISLAADEHGNIVVGEAYSRSSIIQQLSLLVSYLNSSGSLQHITCIVSKVRDIIKRVLDHVLNHTRQPQAPIDLNSSDFAADWDNLAQMNPLDTINWFTEEWGAELSII